MTHNKKQQGFSLLEVMLVLVILVAMGTLAISMVRGKALNARIDRTAEQMQQIMQAAVSYNIDYHTWPTDSAVFSEDSIQELVDKGYLPANLLNDDNQMMSAWGTPYETAISDDIPGESNSSGRLFLVSADTTDVNYANVLKGLLPLGYVSDDQPTTVVTGVNIPSYNYNNAQSVSDMHIYNHGDCVPVPSCPAGMEPNISTAPAGMAGIVASGDNTTYQLQSFLTIAQDPQGYCPGQSAQSSNAQCTGGQTGEYWRVCAMGSTNQVDSHGNPLPILDYSQGDNHTLQILAMTNCVPSDDPQGTQFNR